MSTLVVSNISDGTTTVPATYVTNGSAKAWVNFNGTGTIAARDSLNLSSLTDNGGGQYAINFSSAFGAADYSAVGMVVRSSIAGNGIQIATSTAPSTTSISVETFRTQDGAITDREIVCLNVNGDLA